MHLPQTRSIKFTFNCSLPLAKPYICLRPVPPGLTGVQPGLLENKKEIPALCLRCIFELRLLIRFSEKDLTLFEQKRLAITNLPSSLNNEGGLLLRDSTIPFPLEIHRTRRNTPFQEHASSADTRNKVYFLIAPFPVAKPTSV
ncbi:hypothetical protein CEXT_441431 [Caerostris extrusa]|uniref:SH2 domain-containing protein n=1 Tax=Caerostris extrusa TaxID=172846 RepID=A0AAV4PE49_CAEEX|nr:hypothetical protein CEXT_441431 [Caerostris extrusa]